MRLAAADIGRELAGVRALEISGRQFFSNRLMKDSGSRRQPLASCLDDVLDAVIQGYWLEKDVGPPS
jgi:hypothetical protein